MTEAAVSRMQGRSLQDLMNQVPNLVEYFANDTVAPVRRIQSNSVSSGVPPVFSNWREEQQSWRETVALFDLSHHMPELYIKGPDALRLLSHTGVGTTSNVSPQRAKQFIACTPRGHIIADSILYCFGPESYVLVGSMPTQNWVVYQAQVGKFDVSLDRDFPTAFNPRGRRLNYRFQLDGPNASKLLHRIVDSGMPEIGFFRTAELKIKGHAVRALRHSMGGHGGAEISGPSEESDAVRSIIIEAGRDLGLRPCGALSYYSTGVESGWQPIHLSGIYTGAELEDYRNWLPYDTWEASVQIGGSFRSDNIEDYYLNPYELDYGHLIKMDHDFVGRAALEAMKDKPHRKKVTLVWNKDDLQRLYVSQFGPGPRYKSVELPIPVYGAPHYDTVTDSKGRSIGLAGWCSYSANERALLQLGFLDPAHATPGTEINIVWGEPNGGSRKAAVERHEQTTVRATVAPAPYSKVVQHVGKSKLV